MNRYLTAVFLTAILIPGALQAQEWEPLLDGQSFNGWMQQDGRDVDAPGWEVSHGVVQLDRSRGKGGNLLTREQFGDFELVYEWKVAQGANNGLKYRVNDFDGRFLGIEYQMIDDQQKNPKPKHRTASLYDIYEPREHDLLRPVGEFNRTRILVHNNHIEHWLNGHLVTQADVGSDEWQRRIADSKFADVDGFGVTPRGHIMLTDHGDTVWYRNMFVRRLDAEPTTTLASVCVQPSVRCTSRVRPRCRGIRFFGRR